MDHFFFWCLLSFVVILCILWSCYLLLLLTSWSSPILMGCRVKFLLVLLYWHFLGAFYSVTRNYFENLVRALETGLIDVGPSTSQSMSTKNTTSKNLGGKSKTGKNKAASSKSGSSSRGVDDSNIWTCDQCTYVNPKSAKACQACDHQHR
jgi:hypothetical protein